MTADFSAQYPRYKLSGGKASQLDTGLDAISTKSQGDEMMSRLGILRARMVPHDLWPANVQSFEAAWSRFKYEHDCIDFTDMLEIALRDTSKAPGDPAVLMVDEAQDSSPLMNALAMKWGRRCESRVFAGDPDQLLFSFAGADPSVMMAPVDKEIVLSQSYRCSKAVHGYARRWVQQIKKRNDYEYQPTEQEGFLKKVSFTLDMPEQIIDEAERHVADGKKVMILASCSYMLSGVINEMRERGLLFHNPWRPSNGAWNPVKITDDEDGKCSMVDRLLAFLAPSKDVWGDARHLWTADEFVMWASMIRAEAGISRGMKKALDEVGGSDMIDMRFVADFFSEQCDFWKMFETFRKPEAVAWLEKSLVASKQKSVRYPLRLIDRYGTSVGEPRITVGTIHSVKGAEADVVIVAPDLSQSGVQEYMGRPDARDGVMRLFYVALTRAREGVVLLGQGGNGVRWI
jgi:DNA helicase-2/ATP-dependent DNA helicase PcrA